MLDDGNLSTLKRVVWPTIMVVEGPGQPSTEGCPVARESLPHRPCRLAHIQALLGADVA